MFVPRFALRVGWRREEAMGRRGEQSRTLEREHSQCKLW